MREFELLPVRISDKLAQRKNIISAQLSGAIDVICLIADHSHIFSVGMNCMKQSHLFHILFREDVIAVGGPSGATIAVVGRWRDTSSRDIRARSLLTGGGTITAGLLGTARGRPKKLAKIQAKGKEQ